MAKKKKDTKTYSEPTTRALTDWTPAGLRSALALAESGNMSLVADLCESLMADGRVQGALLQRCHALLGLPIEFECKSKRVKTAIEEDWFDIFPENTHIQLLSWAILLGVGLGEMVWVEKGDRIIPTLKVWNPKFLSYNWQERKWFLQIDGGGSIEITPGDGKWILVTPGGSNRPWTKGAWKAVAKPWLLKTYATSDWGRYSELNGTPVIAGLAPENAGPEVRSELASALGDIGSNTTLVLPSGFDLKLIEASGKTYETFKDAIEWAATEITVAILGQNLTSEVKAGSLAAANVHQIVRRDLMLTDAQIDATTTREQVLKYWAEFNFGTVDVPWPVYQTDLPEDLQEKANTLKTLAETILLFQQAGANVDLKTILDEFGVPMSEPEPINPGVKE